MQLTKLQRNYLPSCCILQYLVKYKILPIKKIKIIKPLQSLRLPSALSSPSVASSETHGIWCGWLSKGPDCVGFKHSHWSTCLHSSVSHALRQRGYEGSYCASKLIVWQKIEEKKWERRNNLKKQSLILTYQRADWGSLDHRLWLKACQGINNVRWDTRGGERMEQDKRHKRGWGGGWEEQAGINAARF